MDQGVHFGEITTREAGYIITKYLEPGTSDMAFELFGQDDFVPQGQTKTALFRRIEKLPVDLDSLTLVEGVMPEAGSVTVTDVVGTLKQLGAYIPYSDQIEDCMTDPMVKLIAQRQGQQQCEAIEKDRFLTLRGATSVFFANGLERAAVNTELSTALVDRVVKSLKRRQAAMVTDVQQSTVEYGRAGIPKSYIGIAPPEVEPAIRDLTGFKGVEDYGKLPPWGLEIGAARQVRWLISNSIEAWADAGGAAGTMQSTTGDNADVFPVMIFGQDFYGKIAHKLYPAKNADAKGKMRFPVVPQIVRPKPAAGNWLGQVGSVGWKLYTLTLILNQMFGTVVQVAARN